MLINNAGFGSMGDFAKLDLNRELEMIQLNIRALVDLTHRFLRRCANASAARSSTSPRPRLSGGAVHGDVRATKAFVLSFSEATWEENRSHGIHVMALCPGVTETNFFEASRMDRPPMRTIQTRKKSWKRRCAARAAKECGRFRLDQLVTMEAERFVPRSTGDEESRQSFASRLRSKSLIESVICERLRQISRLRLQDGDTMTKNL
jgi:short-subunit dehydrogenase